MFCVHCGNEIGASARFCTACGGRVPASPDFGEKELALLVPSNITVASFFAGYLALFGLLLWPLGILALISGVYGLGEIQKNPELAGRGRVWAGIVLGLLEVAATAVFVILWLF